MKALYNKRMLKKEMLFIFFLILSACSIHSDEKKLLTSLKTKYANIAVNNTKKKELTISKIEELAETDDISTSFEKYASLMKEMGDAQLSLNSNSPAPSRSSNIQVIALDPVLVKTCPECKEKILTKVDDLPLNDWIFRNHSRVYASSDHGKRYRTLKLLEQNDLRANPFKKLSFKDKSEHLLKWLPTELINKCVTGELLDEKTYKLNIHSFWCEVEFPNRKKILNHFKAQLAVRLEELKGIPNLIIDLRDNGGGGDQELRYFLSKFISKPTFLYAYQYIGKKKQQDQLRPNKKINYAKKKIAILINSGCFSSCEIAASVFKNSEKRVLIGEQTHGAAGDPKEILLTNSRLTYPTCIVWQEDGSLYEGVGVAPNIQSQGQYMKKALEYLKTN